MNDGITWFAMGFGLGQSQVLPGTLGALLGIPLAWLMLRRQRRVQLFMAAGLILLAVPLCHIASHNLGGKDDRGLSPMNSLRIRLPWSARQ